MGICSSKQPTTPTTDSTHPTIEKTIFGVNYSLQEEIGHGAFSSVRLGTKKSNGEKYAVKCVLKKNLPKFDEVLLRDEVLILREIDHPNIIKLFDFYEESDCFYLVTELMEGGEVFDRVVQKSCYNEKEAQDLIRIFLDALCHCHDQGIVHRDLKPENLLLESKNDDSAIKLADFGFAKKIEGPTLTTRCGTPGYIAPEVLEGKKYGFSVDMWSVGVITYILLGGYPPFEEEQQSVLFEKIKKAEYEFDAEYWDAISANAKDFISKLLVIDPMKRLTSFQAICHPWFLGNAHDLLSRNLEKNLMRLKKYNARRKLRAAARAVMWANVSSKTFTRKTSGISESDGESKTIDTV